MKEGTSFQEHLNRFNTLLSKLISIDVKIEDDEKVTLLLCSMPDTRDSLIMSLSTGTDLDMDSTIATLLTEESCRKTLESTSGNAMMARGTSMDKGSNGRKKSSHGSKTIPGLSRLCCAEGNSMGGQWLGTPRRERLHDRSRQRKNSLRQPWWGSGCRRRKLPRLKRWMETTDMAKLGDDGFSSPGLDWRVFKTREHCVSCGPQPDVGSSCRYRCLDGISMEALHGDYDAKLKANDILSASISFVDSLPPDQDDANHQAYRRFISLENCSHECLNFLAVAYCLLKGTSAGTT
ncbi:hypothetical protein NL676_000308 [Syzygium grande]|nr:hypothetical protein NL676_000308 [Syzygium grande]